MNKSTYERLTKYEDWAECVSSQMWEYFAEGKGKKATRTLAHIRQRIARLRKQRNNRRPRCTSC